MATTQRKRSAIDSEGDFVSNRKGEYVLYADSFAEFIEVCERIVASASEYITKRDIEKSFEEQTDLEKELYKEVYKEWREIR